MEIDLDDLIIEIIAIIQDVIPESQPKYKEALLREELRKYLDPLVPKEEEDF